MPGKEVHLARRLAGQLEQRRGDGLLAGFARHFLAFAVNQHNFAIGADAEFTHACRREVRVDALHAQGRVGRAVALEQLLPPLTRRTAGTREERRFDRPFQPGEDLEARLAEGVLSAGSPVETRRVALGEPAQQSGEQQQQHDEHGILQALATT